MTSLLKFTELHIRAKSFLLSFVKNLYKIIYTVKRLTIELFLKYNLQFKYNNAKIFQTIQ